MVNRDRVGRGEAAIGIETRIEAGEMEAHNVLTRSVLLPPISAHVGTGDSGGAVALKREAGDIDIDAGIAAIGSSGHIRGVKVRMVSPRSRRWESRSRGWPSGSRQQAACP